MEYRNVLITGASSGIGRALALNWVGRGARVWAAARRIGNLEELARESGGLVTPVELDVSNPGDVVKTLLRLDEEIGGFDLVIANAGVADPTPAQTATWEDVSKVIDVNVIGAAATITALIPRMVERGRGHVVGISSIASYAGLGAYSAYCGSKAFVSKFLESLRVDLHGTPVKVTCIEPGFVKSEMQARLEGRAPMPFVVETDAAAEIICRAIVSGARTRSFPFAHTLPARLMAFVPRMVYDPMAQKASKPQLELAAESKAAKR